MRSFEESNDSLAIEIGLNQRLKEYLARRAWEAIDAGDTEAFEGTAAIYDETTARLHELRENRERRLANTRKRADLITSVGMTVAALTTYGLSESCEVVGQSAYSTMPSAWFSNNTTLGSRS